MKKTFSIKGMSCQSCANRITSSLKEKVDKIEVDFVKEKANIEFNPEKISETEIKEIVKKQGYEFIESVGKEIKALTEKNGKNIIGWLVVGGSILLFAYVLYSLFGSNFSLPEFDFNSLGGNASLFLLFFAGLLTGFHCIAMCGGFLVSYTAKNAINGHKSFYQHLVYGGAKTVSYTIIGALFGLIGSFFVFSSTLRGGIGIFAGVFMVFYALSMFGFKFFRKFQFNPKFLTSIASKKYSGAYFGPMMTGLLNGLFIACGPLQALYIYAAGTGSLVQGGLSLMAFGLGTLPVMLGFGGFANVVSHNATRKILKVSAIIVLILGLIMLNRGLALTGSGYDYKSLMAGTKNLDGVSNIVLDSEGYQIIKMDVDKYGWSPDNFVLQKGVPVKWVINVKELTGCNNAIQAPKLNLKFDLKQGEQTIEFTPEEEGVIPWSCWMGMIPGTFVVTSDGSATQEQVKTATAQTASAGGSCGCGGGGSGTCGG